MKTVLINKKKYPVRFSIRALVKFENMTGASISSINTKDMKLGVLIKLAFCGLSDGARKAKKKLTSAQNEEWLLDQIADDPEILTNLMNVFSESQTVENSKKK